MAIAEVVVVPLGSGASVSPYVAATLQVVKDSGMNYQLTPMGTVIEGSVTEILALVEKMHEVQFAEGAVRVSTSLKIDDRRDKEISFASKINAVEEKLK